MPTDSVPGAAAGVRGRLLPRNACWLPALALLALLSFTTTVSADPLLVTSGFAGIDAQDEQDFVLRGDGFSLGGFAHGLGQALNGCNPWLQPCLPGTAMDLSALGVDPGRHVTANWAAIGGTRYEPLYYSGSMDFVAGAVNVPDVPFNRTIWLSAPFAFAAHIAGYDNFELGGSALFALDLIGRGTATVRFTNDEFGLRAQTISYEFANAAPVPEPASLMLLGSALGGAALARRRKRSRAPDA